MARQIVERFHPDDRLMLWFDFFNHDSHHVQEMMRLFMEKVAPAVNDCVWRKQTQQKRAIKSLSDLQQGRRSRGSCHEDKWQKTLTLPRLKNFRDTPFNVG